MVQNRALGTLILKRNTERETTLSKGVHIYVVQSFPQQTTTCAVGQSRVLRGNNNLLPHADITLTTATTSQVPGKSLPFVQKKKKRKRKVQFENNTGEGTDF